MINPSKVFHLISNKYLAGAVLILLFFICSMKIYSVFSLAGISNWNFQQLPLQKINKLIDKTKNEFSFVVFGDNRNSIKPFKYLITKVNEEDALFAVDCGDLVSHGEEKNFRRFLKQIKSLHKPLLTVIGNHDLHENDSTIYCKKFGKLYYSFAIKNSYFVILDDAKENLDQVQMNWLEDELKKSQNYRYRFIFIHVPLYSVSQKVEYQIGHSMKDLFLAKKLNNLFDKNNVTMLFASHIHGYYRGTWGNTPYIITGGAGAKLFGFDPQHYFYHYVRVNVSDNGVHYKVIKINALPDSHIDKFLSIHFWNYMIILMLIYLGCYLILMKKGWLNQNLGKKSDNL
jgi:hypothetical protein